MVPAVQPLFNTAAGFKSFKTFNGCAQFKTVPENSRSKVQTFKVQRSSPEEFKSFNMFKTFQSLRSVQDVKRMRAVQKFKVQMFNVKGELGSKAMDRALEHNGGTYALRERGEAYNGDLGNKSEPLSFENTVFWNENTETAET